MYLPLELLHEIILVSLSSSPTAPEETGVSIKQNWASLEPLTLASKVYRKQALNAWFRTLYAKTPSDVFHFGLIFPDFCGITREFHGVQLNTRKSSVWDLGRLKQLKKIRLDWLSPYMTPHYGSNMSDRLPFTHAPPTVKELDIRGIPWPSPIVFLNIHTIFPNLNILCLRQQRIWCGLCHTCCVPRFSSPGPEKIVYTDGGGLPLHYSRVLRDLQHLHTIYITIADFGGGKTMLRDSPDHNPYRWAGECDSCMEIMYEDKVFRDMWVAKKMDITMNGYGAPPVLNKVEWNFWKAEASEEIDVEESGDELTEELAEEAL
ncbi:hypothetical protein E4T56_gene5103 [Termitomyces sp. T112]|nr:hypothetical protein E4T56_gene5103 [Termitomyces sp. T112]